MTTSRSAGPPARLVFLSGSKAGTTYPLGLGRHTVGRRADQAIRFLPGEALVSGSHAAITREGDQFVLEDLGSRNGTLVNKARVTHHVLQAGDLIEFGPGGPTARFALGDDDDLTPTLDAATRHPAATLYREARARAEDRTRITGTHRAFSTTREFVALAYGQSSRRTRWTTLGLAAVTLLGFAGIVAWQSRDRRELETALTEIAEALAVERGSRSALEANLEATRRAYDSLLGEVERSQDRLEANGSAGFAETVNRNFGPGVALIVSAYGFLEPGGDRLLRYQLDGDGEPAYQLSPRGTLVPRIGFGGEGPPVTEQSSATGFLIDSTGWILTNRHVATPWNYDEALERVRESGVRVEPTFTELRAYFPPGDQVFELDVVGVSAEADVAVLRVAGGPVAAPALDLAAATRRVAPGEQIVFIGYPTGVHNLMFRVSREERVQILEAHGERPVNLAAELARRRLIQPLVIAGTVSDTTAGEIIHTAGVTGGGSGGPIVGQGNRVVGIHYAAVRSPIQGDPFQTQRGVPVGFAWEILPASVRTRLAALQR